MFAERDVTLVNALLSHVLGVKSKEGGREETGGKEGGEGVGVGRASYTLGALSDASSDPETNPQPNAGGECAFQPEGSAKMLEINNAPC